MHSPPCITGRTPPGLQERHCFGLNGEQFAQSKLSQEAHWGRPAYWWPAGYVPAGYLPALHAALHCFPMRLAPGEQSESTNGVSGVPSTH